MRIKWKKFLVLFLAVALFGTNTISMAEEAMQSRRFSILSISGDEAYVVKGSTKEVKATAGMPLGQGSKVRTGFQTSLYVEADDDKTIKLDSNTQAEITKVSSKSLKITLKSGEIFFNVEKPLGEGEELTFDAAQTSMSIRGTSGVLNYSQNRITFYLIEGEVHWNIGNQIISLSAGQKASLLPGSQEQLQANGMTSVYQLSEVTAFEWNELSAMVLEALIEQMEQIDLSAIGLDSQEAREQVMTQIQQMKQEKQVQTEAQIRELEEVQTAVGNANGVPVRIDGGEPETRRNENRRQSGSGRTEITEEDVTTEERPTTGDETIPEERPTESIGSEDSTPSEDLNVTPVPTKIPTVEPNPTATPTETPSTEPSPTVTPTETPSVEPSSTATPTETPSVEPSSTATPTETPSATLSPTATPIETPSATLSPTATPTETPSAKLSPTATPTETPSVKPSPTVTPTETPSTEPSSTATEESTSTLFQKPLPSMVKGTPIYGYFEISGTPCPDRPIYDYDDKGNPMYFWNYSYPIYGWDSNDFPIYDPPNTSRVLTSTP